MSTINTADTVWTGRKGVAYDWRTVVAAAEASHLDRELEALVPTLAAAES